MIDELVQIVWMNAHSCADLDHAKLTMQDRTLHGAFACCQLFCGEVKG